MSKKILACLASVLILATFGFSSFALDAEAGLGNETQRYLGMDDIVVYRLSDDISQQHQISFFVNDDDNTFAAGYNNFNNQNLCLLEYRPMRSVYLGDTGFTETRVTFKGDVIYFHFSDIFINYDKDLSLQNVYLTPYTTNPNAMINVNYKFSIFDFRPNKDGDYDLVKHTFETDDTFDQSDGNAMIPLIPNLENAPHHGGACYIENLTVELQLVRPNSENIKFYMRGDTTTVDHCGYRYFLNAVDYQPSEFNLISNLFYDIQRAMNVEIAPHITIGAVFSVIVAIPLLIMVLKLFLGG